MNQRGMVVLLALVLVPCCKDSSTEVQTSVSGKFYLETEYVSLAWGRHVHRGEIIDNDGLVVSYDMGPSPQAWPNSSSELYSETELQWKIHHNDTVRGRIPADTLSRLRSLAYGSVSGVMSDTTGGGADIGLMIYSCYTIEGADTLFRRTELRAHGDMEYYNTSASAIELSNWMAKRN